MLATDSCRKIPGIPVFIFILPFLILLDLENSQKPHSKPWELLTDQLMSAGLGNYLKPGANKESTTHDIQS